MCMRLVCMSCLCTQNPFLRLRLRQLLCVVGTNLLQWHWADSDHAGHDEQQECMWECLHNCRVECSSYAAVKKHKQRCQVPMNLIEQAPSADPQAEQGSSGYSTMPESESAGSLTSMGSPCAST